MNPALLLGAAAALLLLGRKSGTTTSMGHAGARGPIIKLDAIKIVKLDLMQLADDGVIPFYKGFPDSMAIPSGYQAMKLAVREDGKTFYDPRRFLQWSALTAEHEPGTQAFSDAQDEWVKTYYFGVVDGDAFTLYVLAKPTSPGSCCRKVECQREYVTQSGKKATVHEEYRGYDVGGHESGHKARLDAAGGEPWSCTCVDRGPGCWILTPPPAALWPRA